MEKTFIRILPYFQNPHLVNCPKVDLRLDRQSIIQIHLARIRIGYRQGQPKCNCDFTGFCSIDARMIELRRTK